MKSSFTITHKCKHEQVHDLSNVQDSKRLERVGWLKTRDCKECWLKEQKRETSKEWKAKQAQELKEFEDKFDYHPLNSKSEKAAKYGQDCRHKLIKNLYIELVEDGQVGKDDFESNYLEPSRMIDRPSWWIEHSKAFDEDGIELGDFENLFKAAAQDIEATSTENPY